MPPFFAGAWSGRDVPELRLLIGGEWRAAAGGETFDVHSPVDGTLIA